MHDGQWRNIDDEPVVSQFLHHLRNTLILLGGDTRFATLLNNPGIITELATLLNNPGIITEADVADLKRYNTELVGETKKRLIVLNKLAIILKAAQGGSCSNG